MAPPRSVVVIIVCHNYGRYLTTCLQSVLAQSLRPTDILIVDDASTDDTASIAASFEAQGVRYLRVSHHNVHRVRAAGFEASHSDVVCFLDADDELGLDYLSAGLAAFSEPSVAVVYSDIEQFGAEAGWTHYADTFNRDAFVRDNYLHAGSLVLREALLQSRAFERDIDPLVTQGDWFLWRQVLQHGWTARKQTARYRYRKHESNWTHGMRQAAQGYFEYAGLAHQPVTLLIPLSGRTALWPELAAFLERQTWQHSQTKLLLCDSSGSPEFFRQVREWVARTDYADVRCVQWPVSRAGLADENRHDAEVQQDVRLAMARIYNFLGQQATTDYVWILEDDILPSDDVCEQLLRGFDADTGSVSALYHSRFDGKPCVWDSHWQHYSEDGTGLSLVHGNGFGCVLFRAELLRKAAFKNSGDFDRLFYREVASSGWKVKVNWQLFCEHRSLPLKSLTATGCVCPESGWCELHQCHKTPHWHQLCQHRADYFRLWDEGRGPGQGGQTSTRDGNPSEEPGLIRKAINFGVATVRHAADGARHVSSEVYEARIAVCRACPSCDVPRMVCREKSCGCQLYRKARWRSENCPLKKWQDISEENS